MTFARSDRQMSAVGLRRRPSVRASSPANAPANAVEYMDDVASDAYALWSTRRQMSSGAASAFTVRRSSDSAEQPIGFTSAGLVDTAALLSFVGGGDGFLAEATGQVGVAANNVTAVSQPQLVSSGSLVTAADGGLAASFDNINDRLIFTAVSSADATGLCYAVMDFSNTVSNPMFGLSTTPLNVAGYMTTIHGWQIRGSGSSALFSGDVLATSANKLRLFLLEWSGTNVSWYVNGTQQGTTLTSGEFTPNLIGGYFSDQFADGRWVEAGLWTKSNTPSRAAVTADVMGFYSGLL